MGSGHSHRAPAGATDEVTVASVARNALLGSLLLVAVATVVGLVVWWPSGDDRAGDDASPATSFAAPGVTFPEATVVAVGEPCPEGRPDGEGCGQIRVDVGADDGGEVDVPVQPAVLDSGLAPGDEVQLQRIPAAEDGGQPAFAYFATVRDGTLVWLLVLFVAVVLATARLRGLLALVGLAVGGAVVWWFMLPALLEGAPGIGVALAGSTAIMFVVLYTTHGPTLRTSTALLGTVIGIALTAALGVLALTDGDLTGVTDEDGAILGALNPDLSFQSLLGCALVVAGLGVLNDVTITQASAVWELRASSPTASRRDVFGRAMRIGRDHIASTIYTIVFAYVGTALVVLLLIRVYERPILDLVSTEQFAEEIVRTLVTSVGLVLAVPLTTAIAAVVAGPARDGDAADAHDVGDGVTGPDRATPAAPSPRPGPG